MRNRNRFWLWVAAALFLTSGSAIAVTSYKNAISFGPGVGSWNSATGSSSGHGIYWNSTTGQAVMHKEGGPDVVWGTAGTDGGAPPTPTSNLVRAGGVGPTNSVAGAGGATYGLDFYIPTDATNQKIHIANYQVTVSGASGVAAVTGVNVGLCTSSGGGAWTCSGTEQSWLGNTLAADGSDLILPVSPALPPGSDGRILLWLAFDSSSTVGYSQFNDWGFFASGTTVNPPPAFSTPNTNPALGIHLEYTSNRHRVVVMGDSLSVGASTSGTVPGYIRAWPQLLAKNHNWAVDVEGYTGQKAATFVADANAGFIWTEPVYLGAACVWAMGTNDYQDGAIAVWTAMLKGIEKLRSRGCATIDTYTVAPCAAYSAFEANRVALNGMLKTMPPEGIRNVYDIDTLLDPTHSGSLSATACGGGTCDAGDGCHWSIAGHVAVEASVFAGGL